MRSTLLDGLSVLLLKEGFTTKMMEKGCFDILARREDILLIKVLNDANAVSEGAAGELKKLGAYVDGVPLIVAEKAGGALQNNVVYVRYGVYTMNSYTFKSCVNRRLPIVKSTQAGFTTALEGEKLKRKREEFGYSLHALAAKLGVSSRMVAKYEAGESEITLKKALKLYDLFGRAVFREVGVFDSVLRPFGLARSDISKKYLELGFEAAETERVPFDVIARRQSEVILTEVGDKQSSELIPMARLLDVNKLVIFGKHKPKDIPAMSKKEFLEFEKASELIKFIKEFET
ncbi:MAG: helix-turn-helix domain-containing protein [Candidatus Woesearchaeota archaeon]